MKQIEIVVKKNEEKLLPFVWVNEKEDQFELSVRLIGEGASVKIVGLFFGSKTNSFVFNTKVTHEAPQTKSLTTLRAVFSEKSSFSSDGLIIIKKNAKGADGYFASKVLLFDDAKGRSVPSLEIDENELKAGHASTIGRPDPLQLFYLQSRGLSGQEATKLIIGGFFDPLLKMLPQDDRSKMFKKLQYSIV